MTQVATVAVTRDTTPANIDTLSTAAQITYDFEAADPISGQPGSITAIIDSFLIRSKHDTTYASRELSSPLTLDIEASIPLTPATVDSTASSISPPCDVLADAAADIARGLVFPIPPAIGKGLTWSDSTRRVQCRSGIPLIMATWSNYRIQDIRESTGTRFLEILRTTTLRISGVAASPTQPIQLVGFGDSETLFLYELDGGRFLGANSRGSLSLHFQTPRHLDRVIQQSIMEAELIPGLPPGGRLN